MKPRWCAFGIFLAALALLGFIRGCSCTEGAPTGPNWLAAVELWPNSRLEADHLKMPRLAYPILAWGLPKKGALIGKYLNHPLKPGEAIPPERLTPQPAISASYDQALLAFPAKELLPVGPSLNKNAMVYVCGTEPAGKFGPYPIEAVFGSGAATTVLLRVGKNDVAALVKVDKPRLLLVALPSL